MADEDDENDDAKLDATWGIGKKPRVWAQPSARLVRDRDKEEYEAFIAKDKVLELGLAYGGGHDTFSYSHLLFKRLNTHQTMLSILTTTGVIEIRGRNLRSVETALTLHTCEDIIQFDPASHLAPTDKTKAFIERIEVTLTRPLHILPIDTKDETTPEDA